MSAKEFRWLFVVVLIAVVVIGNLAPPTTLGISSEWTNGDYRLAGGTVPLAILISFLVVGLYILLMHSRPTEQRKPLPGVLRRFMAFMLDFVLGIIAIAPIAGILPTVTEWRRTGTFEWTFERTTHAPGDAWLIAIVMIATFAGLVFYFAYPLARGRPSPGACIAGYQIVPDEGAFLTPKTALLRTLLGFVAAGTWYVAPFIARDRKQGKFWLDKVFGTRAVKLS